MFKIFSVVLPVMVNFCENILSLPSSVLTQVLGVIGPVTNPSLVLTCNTPPNLKLSSVNLSLFKYERYVDELNGYISFLYDSGV